MVSDKKWRIGVPHLIDERLGSELGLTGRFENVPAFQIVNSTHDTFLTLTSRLISLEYGSNGDAFTSHPSWDAIDILRSDLASQLSMLGGDARRAAFLSEKIRALCETVDHLVAAVDPSRQSE